MKFVDAKDSSFTAASKVGAFKGAVANCNNKTYHSLKSYWSSSDLKALSSSSPAHFNAEYFLRESKVSASTGETTVSRVLKERDFEPTKDMILGSLVHCYLLEPTQFEADFFMLPELNLRTKADRETRDQMLIENAGKMAVTDELIAQAKAMRDSVMRNPQALRVLEPGYKEASFWWTCQFSHLNFKAKLDQSCSKHFCELKTTESCEREWFSKHADNMNYDLSLYHYREGLRNIMGLELPAYFIVVERNPPHVCQVYRVGDMFWETGHAKWLRALEQLEIGLAKDLWPGYFDENEEVEIQPPPWKLNKFMKEQFT